MEKYLIDTSIVGSSLQEFKSKYANNNNSILCMSNLTFFELEARKVDPKCDIPTESFVRWLINYFVKETKKTEVFNLTKDVNDKVDTVLVNYAKENNLTVITSDKGMALYCRFQSVECILLEVRYSKDFRFVEYADDNSRRVNVFNTPDSYAVFVKGPSHISGPDENGYINLENNDRIFQMHYPFSTSAILCEVDEYLVTNNSIDYVSTHPFDTEEQVTKNNYMLYQKWCKSLSYIR